MASVKFILDTDHISLYQRQHRAVSERILSTSASEIATTVITLEEQLRGRLDLIRRAKRDADIVRRYRNLQVTSLFFRSIHIIEYNEQSQQIFNQLRQQKIRIGTQDLRIAAIALHHKATLVTANQRDFRKVPDLALDDWSISDFS